MRRTHERLIAGEVFRVSETFEGADGTLYLKLADGRGWVFESKAGIGTLCVRCQSDSVARLQDHEPLYGYGERRQSPDIRNDHTNYRLLMATMCLSTLTTEARGGQAARPEIFVLSAFLEPRNRRGILRNSVRSPDNGQAGARLA